MTPLDKAIAAFTATQPQDHDGFRHLWAEWATQIAQAPEVLAGHYQTYLDTVRQSLDGNAPPALGGQAGAGRFILAFANGTYLPDFQHKKRAWTLLQSHHAEHLSLIRQALLRPDHVVFDDPPRGATGRWGAVVGAMLTLYRQHKVFGPGSEVLEGDVIPLMPAFFRAFPQEGNHILLSMLADHPDAADVMADWLRYHCDSDADLAQAPTVSVALDLLGPHGHQGGAFFAMGARIFAQLLRDAVNWPPTRLAAFWRAFVEAPMQIEPVTQQDAAKKARHLAAMYRRWAEQEGDDTSFAAQARRERNENSARAQKAEAEQIEADFDAWTARRRRSAVRSLASSATRRKTLAAVAQRLPSPYAAMAKALLDEAKADAARPRLFAIGKPAQNRFRDPGFKLLVIEELMYRQGVLLPKFDIHALAAEYDKREIRVELEGYAIIPEAKTYFANLPIADDLLTRVTTLHQSSGMDGGPRHMDHLFPFWDPGAGDGPVPVTAKAVADLDLLPNLTRISGLENSKPNRTLLAALKARGIALLPEGQKQD